MKNLFLAAFIAFALLTTCNETSTDESINIDEINTKESVEDKAIKAITNLPEYHDANVHIKAITNGEQSVSMIIEAPNEFHDEYYIQVGYNQESWFEPYYHFYVDPETFDVYIEDVLEGDLVSIGIWREREKTR